MVFQKVTPNAAPEAHARGDVKDQSSKSRHRAAFAFGNAECTWLCMILLTWHHAPDADAVKSSIAKLRRLWNERWGEPMDAWLMEMHARGVPHFHLFVAAESAFGAACMSSEKRTVVRKCHTTTIIGGAPERWLVGAWLECTGQLGDEDALAFNRGGIIEMLRSADAAGRYVAKECSKREQKILPERYASGLGRWWWLNPRWQPRAVESYQVSLAEWPFENPMSHVWEASAVDCLQRLAPLAPDPSRRLYTIGNRTMLPPSPQIQLPLPLPGPKNFREISLPRPLCGATWQRCHMAASKGRKPVTLKIFSHGKDSENCGEDQGGKPDG